MYLFPLKNINVQFKKTSNYVNWNNQFWSALMTGKINRNRMKSFVVVVLLLTGCAATSGVNVDSLSSPKKDSHFVLLKDIFYVAVPANVIHPDVINGLSNGTYTAKYEDSDGIFYEGPKGCLLPFKHNGGIWLPKRGSKEQPVLWAYIINSSQKVQEENGVVAGGIASWEAGRVRKMWGGEVGEKLLTEINILTR